jgi:hypothetical protein
LLTPHVSNNPIFSSKYFVQNLKPKAEIIPASKPQTKLAAGCVNNPDGAPIITPPAKVALNISSISNFYRTKAVIMNAPRQLPVKEIIVLIIIIDFYCPFTGKYPALNEGQNIHKNNVPIIAKVKEEWLV